MSEARLVLTVPLQAGRVTTTDSIPVSATRKCQLTAEFHPEWRILDYPDSSSLAYRVMDDAGKVLLAATVEIGQLVQTTNEWTHDVEFSYRSDKFDPPKSGQLRVEAILTSEGKTRRFIKSEVKLYDTVSDHTESAVYGTALSLFGGVLILLGGALLVASRLDRRPASSV